MNKQISSVYKILIFILVLSFGFSSTLDAWTGPAAQPPAINTEAPLNIGASPQTKVGGDICTTVLGATKCLQDVVNGLPSGASGQTIRNNGGINWVVDGAIFNNGTNVGVGTLAPTEKFEVANSSAAPFLSINNTTAGGVVSSGIRYKKNGVLQVGMGVDRAGDGTRNMWFHDYVAGLTRMLIDSSGNVGIGITAPVAKLDVSSASNSQPVLKTQSYGPLNSDTTILNDLRGGWEAAFPNNTILRVHAYNDAAGGLTVKNGGNVGIGTTNPINGKLEVSGAISTGAEGIKWKVFSGVTTIGTPFTTFVHGLNESSIVSMTGFVRNNTGRYIPPESSVDASWKYSVFALGGILYVYNLDVTMQGQPYKIIVQYQ